VLVAAAESVAADDPPGAEPPAPDAGAELGAAEDDAGVDGLVDPVVGSTVLSVPCGGASVVELPAAVPAALRALAGLELRRLGLREPLLS
jgi:hypothetical protein